MSQAVRDTVAELESQRVVVARELSEAQSLFEASTKQLQRLDAAITSMRELYELDQDSQDHETDEGIDSASDEGEHAVDKLVAAPERIPDEQSPWDSVTPPPKPPRRRIQSTAIVADIVSSANQPITRHEIRARFRESGLAPASWQNPDNAIGNAIVRAVERGLIREASAGVYVPVRTRSADFENHQGSY